jgi:hypothetical protein
MGMLFPFKIQNMPADFVFLAKNKALFQNFLTGFLLRRFLSLSVKEQNANFDAAVFERIKCGQSCDPIRFNKSKLGAAPPGSPGKGGAQLGVPPIYK